MEMRRTSHFVECHDTLANKVNAVSIPSLFQLPFTCLIQPGVIMNKAVILFVLSIWVSSVMAGQYKDGWTSKDVDLVGQSCLLALKVYATVDHMQKNQVTEDQLTDDFYKQLDGLLESYRPQCECISDKIASQYSLDEYRQDMKTISATYTKKILETKECGDKPFKVD